MIALVSLLLLISQSLGQESSCPGLEDDQFCDIIEQSPEYYLECENRTADLLPHPLYCTLYIQCEIQVKLIYAKVKSTKIAS